MNIWFYGPGIFLPVTLLLLLFPDGRPPSPRWRPILWLTILGNACVLLGNAFDPATDTADARFLTANPFGVEALAGVLGTVVNLGFFAAIAAVLLAPVAMVLRLRRSRGDERRQMTWLAYAGVLVVLSIAGVIVVGSITGWQSDSTGEQVGQVLVIASLALLPIAAGIGILKYRLYDIDVVINKTRWSTGCSRPS
jgi:hypothetical protein